MDSLYDTDALAWSEQQADLLRRLAGGERLNEAVDWPNVIEEVADAGLSSCTPAKPCWSKPWPTSSRASPGQGASPSSIGWTRRTPS